MIDQTSLSTHMFGRENEPNILLLSSSKADGPADLISLAQEMARNPSTLWHNLDTSYSFLEEEFPIFIDQYELSEKQGFFVVDRQPGTAAINSYVYRFLFFLFPAGMDPLQALEILDRQQEGTLPPALVAALVAVAHGFECGNFTLEGPPAIFAMIADQMPSTGTSTLSNIGFMSLIEQLLDRPNQSSLRLANTLPKSALDRAKFLVTLSELCWQPAYRRKLFDRLGADPTFALISSAWLSSGPTFIVLAGIPFANGDFLCGV